MLDTKSFQLQREVNRPSRRGQLEYIGESSLPFQIATSSDLREPKGEHPFFQHFNFFDWSDGLNGPCVSGELGHFSCISSPSLQPEGCGLWQARHWDREITHLGF